MDGTIVSRLAKQPAMFEGKFQLAPQVQLTQEEETLNLLGSLMVTFLERAKG
jgi:hypothetical protein